MGKSVVVRGVMGAGESRTAPMMHHYDTRIRHCRRIIQTDQRYTEYVLLGHLIIH